MELEKWTKSVKSTWQIYSINFVPTVESVFREVRRVLKGGGIYFLQFANPFAIGIDEEKWDGKAYPLNSLYIDGEDLSEHFPKWNVGQPDRSAVLEDCFIIASLPEEQKGCQ